MIALALAFSVAACASNYETTVIQDNRAEPISPDASLLVAVEGDGSYIDKIYPGSGNMARRAMVLALSKYATDVSAIPDFMTAEAATLNAKAQNAGYLVYLSILNWEDRATEWSGRPDRIEIAVRLIDGNSGDLLESKLVKASSKWATFGGDHPQDLLKTPFDQYAAGIFGQAPSPVPSGQ